MPAQQELQVDEVSVLPDDVERITTEVRTDNGPMLAINATLGFRRIAMRQLTRTPAIAIG